MSDVPASDTHAIAPPATVVLTGISGFIAKRIAADLLDAGHAVRGTLRALDRADEVRAALRPALSDPAALDRLSFAAADLTSDAGWGAAMAGAEALVHTASPFPIAQPKDADALIRPAVDGTLRALRAAREAGVTRVVLTSSIVAILYSDRPADHVFTEADWTDPGHPTANAYAASKTLAERAAWDFAAEHPEMRLTAINPGLVAGTPLDARYGSSLQVVDRFLSGRDPAVPNFGLPVVDIADVSAMHLAALARPETAGRRYIAADDFVMAPRIAAWLAEAFPNRRIATRTAPVWLLRLLALFDAEVRAILPQIGRETAISNARAREEMGIDFTPARDAILAAARFIDAHAAGRAA
jgi:dihydroflavonol-4-reductase